MSKYEYLLKEYQALDEQDARFVDYLTLLFATHETQRIIGDYAYYNKITQKRLKDLIKELTEKGFLKPAGNYNYYLELDEEFKIRRFRTLLTDKENIKTLNAIEKASNSSGYFYHGSSKPDVYIRKYLAAIILKIGNPEEIISSCERRGYYLDDELTKIYAYPEYDDILLSMPVYTRIKVAGQHLDRELMLLEPSRCTEEFLENLLRKRKIE